MSNYAISLCTGFLTRALGLLSTVVLTRLLPLEAFGLLTLVQTCGQTASSLFRLGSNYSYTVLLPKRLEARARISLALSYSRLGSLLCVPFSLIVAIYTAGSIWRGDYTYISDTVGSLNLILLLLCIVLTECLSELLWSVIFPLKDTMNYVLCRDPFVASIKLLLPLVFFSVWGIQGIFYSVLTVSLLSLLGAMRVGDWLNLRIFYSSILQGKLSDMVELTRFGFAGYVFPLITNLIMLPLLLKSVSLGEVSEIGALRIGSWGAQIVTFIGASIAPVLLVKNSRQATKGQPRTKVADFCATIYSVFFGLACISLNYINDSVFLGKYSGYEQLQLIVVAGAVAQSLVQLLLQYPLRPVQQLRVNTSLCASLVSGFLLIHLLNPQNVLTSYALVPFTTNILFILTLFFFKSLRTDLAIGKTTMFYLIYSSLVLLANLAFRDMPSVAWSTVAVGSISLAISYSQQRDIGMLS